MESINDRLESARQWYQPCWTRSNRLVDPSDLYGIEKWHKHFETVYNKETKLLKEEEHRLPTEFSSFISAINFENKERVSLLQKGYIFSSDFSCQIFVRSGESYI